MSTERKKEEKRYSPELLDELPGESKTAQNLLGQSGIIQSLSKESVT